MNQNFQSLAKFLDSFEGKKSKSLSKAEKMSRFLSLPLNRNYPLIRLLMPKEDSRVYNIKQSKVAKIYISILGITESMDDAKNLILFSDPTKATNRKTIGDLGLTILEILNSRIGSSRADHSTLSIDQVNTLLDQLAVKSISTPDRIALFNQIFLLSPLEQKWFIRIILLDLRIGLTGESILKAYHQDASYEFKCTGQLENTVNMFIDPSNRSISVFFSNLDYRDGERITMHKQGEKYIWYSRKNHDYSTTYGSDKSSGSMTPFIYDLFPDNVIDVILDGEMLAINITTSELLPFGSVKGASKSVLKGDSIIRPIFFVFDVLYLNGTILIDSTLEKRFQILSKIFKQRDNVLKILSHDVGYNKDDLVRLFDKRILSNEEGIIIKNPKSKYQIDARNNDWIKLKPEYFDQLGDTIDVAVIGVEWGTGRRAGMLTQLTVAIYDDTLDRMVPCGRVGSGLKDEEFRAFTDSVRDDFVTFDMKRLPKWITFPPNLKEKPALILKSIDRAPVIELSVSELVKSPGYGIAKFTFRFPRIKSIRTDKSSRDIITLTRFHALGDSNTGKMYNKTMNTSADSQPIKKRIVKGKVYSIGAENIGANIDGIEIESNLFSGYVFCLRFGNDEKEIEFKQDIQKTIHRFGGSFVENTSDSTNMVITNCGTDVSKITSQRVLNLIKIGKYDIVDVKWIQDCVDSNSIRILSKYLVYCTLETRKSLKQYSDRYGDSYTEDVTPESLKSFFDIIDGAKFDRYVEIETRDKIVPGTKIQKIRAELNDRYFNKVGFFERSIVYFDSGKILVDVDIFEEDYIDLVDDIVIFKDPVVPSLEHQLGILKVKSGGGLISSVLNNQVTHIVVFDDQRLKIFGAIKTRLKDRHTRSVKLITGKWLLNWEID